MTIPKLSGSSGVTLLPVLGAFFLLLPGPPAPPGLLYAFSSSQLRVYLFGPRPYLKKILYN